jgi:hypothetical protein
VEKILLKRQQDGDDDPTLTGEIIRLMKHEQPPILENKLESLQRHLKTSFKSKEKGKWLKGQRLCLTFVELQQIVDDKIAETDAEIA